MVELPVSVKFPELFHYTSIESLEAIFRSRQFWATHYADMNDTTEHKRFSLKALAHIRPLVFSKFRERMKIDAEFSSRVAAGGGIERVADREAETHIRVLHESIFGRLAGPFIVSFCSHLPQSHASLHGLLSQWRGYGASGGVAIVFSTAAIEGLMAHEARVFAHAINHLGDVKYDDDEAGIHKDFKAYFDFSPEIIDAFYSGIQPPYQRIFSAYVRGTTLVKHHAFHEECELRIVICPRTTDSTSVFYSPQHAQKPVREMRFRPKGLGEARYIEIFGSQSLPVERVIVGPSRIQHVTKQRVEQLLAGAQVAVTTSDIPFIS